MCPELSAPITDKKRMYELLASGALGNTVPQWFSIEKWQASPEARPYAVWGVRTLTPGGPCKLYCHRDDVADTARDYQRQGHAINISVMLDAVRTVSGMFDVYDRQEGSGLLVYGIERPPKGANWRAMMPTQGRTWEGLAARMLLRRLMTPSSLEDLWAVFDIWPGHVLEISTVEGTFGTIPGRNSIVWEVRLY